MSIRRERRPWQRAMRTASVKRISPGTRGAADAEKRQRERETRKEVKKRYTEWVREKDPLLLCGFAFGRCLFKMRCSHSAVCFQCPSQPPRRYRSRPAEHPLISAASRLLFHGAFPPLRALLSHLTTGASDSPASAGRLATRSSGSEKEERERERRKKGERAVSSRTTLL